MPWFQHGRQLEGYTAIIVAQGPSLRDRCLQIQVELASRLYPTICIKDTYRFAPQAHMIYACDRSWWFKRWKEREDLRAHKAVKVTLDWQKLDTKVPELYWLKVGSSTTFVFEEGKVANGKNSGHQCLNCVANMGARKIILVAYDMGFLNGITHCHDDHVKVDEQVFQQYRGEMEKAAPALAARGIQVVNVSRNSTLKCFPKMTFKEALEWGRYGTS